MRRVFLWLGLLIAMAGACAGYLLCTTPGSSAVVRWAIAHYVQARRITIQQMEGTLARGLVFHGVTIQDLHVLPVGNQLAIERLAVSLVPKHLQRSRITGGPLSLRVPGFGSATIAQYDGSMTSGFSLGDVVIENLGWWPDSSRLEIQRVDVDSLMRPTFNPSQAGLKVYNGRLRLPYAEPLLVSGTYTGGRFAATLYSMAVDLPELRELFPRLKFIRTALGTFNDVTLHVTGTRRELHVRGTFRAETVSRAGLTVTQSPGSLALRCVIGPAPVQLYGTVTLQAGTVTAKHTTIHLEPSLLTFTGDPRTPAFNMRGTSTIDGTTIRVMLHGTRDAPDLRLTSVPPVPQERLLATLATGQRWQGAATPSGQEQISPDLAKDFIDYFVFGGLGSRLGQRLGISAVSLTYEPETNTMGVKTTIRDKVAVSYEAEQQREEDLRRSSNTASQEPGRRPPTTYRVGAEYKVTPETSVKIEGEREFLQPAQTQRSTDPLTAGATPAAAQTRDQVFLKIERRF